MSEISKNEIKSMTKEQNYIRGYKDGKSDVLDKIKAEIMQLYNEVEVVDYDHNDISRIKKAHWITREEVLWIIDKYNSHPKRGADMRECEE